MRLFQRGPRHCGRCGDIFVHATYRDGYDRRTGEAIIRSFWKCPRSLDSRPLYLDSTEADCSGLAPWACAVERALYAEHQPPRCRHHSVSEGGENCWDKDGNPITQAGVIVVPVLGLGDDHAA